MPSSLAPGPMSPLQSRGSERQSARSRWPWWLTTPMRAVSSTGSLPAWTRSIPPCRRAHIQSAQLKVPMIPARRRRHRLVGSARAHQRGALITIALRCTRSASKRNCQRVPPPPISCASSRTPPLMPPRSLLCTPRRNRRGPQPRNFSHRRLCHRIHATSSGCCDTNLKIATMANIAHIGPRN